MLRRRRVKLQIQQIPDRVLYGVDLRGREETKFPFEAVLVNAGQALDIHSGVFGKPFGFSDIHFTA